MEGNLSSHHDDHLQFDIRLSLLLKACGGRPLLQMQMVAVFRPFIILQVIGGCPLPQVRVVAAGAASSSEGAFKLRTSSNSAAVSDATAASRAVPRDQLRSHSNDKRVG